ncbi:hypothetical protein [Streptomyces sp. CdTB01]|uniref:hypothetical protein n=1 Tax=Streptomyces sp. CdTB01 TaxID=1725411 RepID=UPI00073A5B9D|nr:hypothetical protein [Streptomyces sp. CdTB01]ALV34592.1 hypothetical protein AS200_22990 [Streptomyces sp. CdTB01]
MAHAAPARGGGMMGKVRANRADRPTRTPDLFDERVHTVGRYAIPVVLGLVYGFWAASNRRHGGEITGWNILFGFVTAAVFIVLCIAVATFAPLLKRELHSLVKSAFAGAAVGFLYSQTGDSVLRSVALGVGVTAAVFLVFFYRYYTREDAEGRRIR